MPESLLFRDWVEFQPAHLRSDALQLFEDLSKEKGRDLSLLVDSPATWSGYLLNGRVYPGVHMKEGVRTWCDASHGGTDHFNKPVLMFHNSADGEPIGRVVHATFDQLWSGDRFFEDWKEPARSGDPGSGRSNLRMRITLPDAIDKFLRKEYYTFSTSFDSPHAICTVCGTNIRADGWCGHVPGKTYSVDVEGEDVEVECYMVTGQMFYKEVSVVNDPAQPRAVVTSMQLEDALKDGREYASFLSADVGIPSMLLQDANSGTGTVLTLQDGEKDRIPTGKGTLRRRPQIQIPAPASGFQDTLVATVEEPAEKADLANNEDFALAHIAATLKEQGLLKTDDEVTLSDVCVMGEHSVVGVGGLTQMDGDHDHVHSVYLTIDMKKKVLRGWTEGTFTLDENKSVEWHSHPIEIPIADLNDDVFEGETRDASSGANHTHNVRVVMNRDALTLGPSYTDLLDLIEEFRDDLQSDRFWDELHQDKKLSTKERKKLKASQFCGPGKSFPVPDCAHVTAARRLIGRYKGSADEKKRILACVSRKAESLGCGGGDAIQLATEHTDMTKLNDSGAGGAKSPTPEEMQAMVDKLEVRVSDQSEKIETLLGEKTDLQAQKDQKEQELTDITQKLTDANTEIHRLTAMNLAILRAVSGHADARGLDTPDKIAGYAKKLQERELQSLQDSITDEQKAFSDRVTVFAAGTSGVPTKILEAQPADGASLTRKEEDSLSDSKNQSKDPLEML